MRTPISILGLLAAQVCLSAPMTLESALGIGASNWAAAKLQVDRADATAALAVEFSLVFYPDHKLPLQLADDLATGGAPTEADYEVSDDKIASILKKGLKLPDQSRAALCAAMLYRIAPHDPDARLTLTKAKIAKDPTDLLKLLRLHGRNPGPPSEKVTPTRGPNFKSLLTTLQQNILGTLTVDNDFVEEVERMQSLLQVRAEANQPDSEVAALYLEQIEVLLKHARYRASFLKEPPTAATKEKWEAHVSKYRAELDKTLSHLGSFQKKLRKSDQDQVEIRDGEKHHFPVYDITPTELPEAILPALRRFADWADQFAAANKLELTKVYGKIKKKRYVAFIELISKRTAPDRMLNAFQEAQKKWGVLCRESNLTNKPSLAHIVIVNRKGRILAASSLEDGRQLLPPQGVRP
jgi:hypothetical protein